jgi:hypothetical protein
MLGSEIENAQRKVKTDAYQMSIGELVNMYKESELIINPDFQRLFRWEIGQKAKLIESVLLGIPIPSIFVFETDDAKWELIDGLQRISTILEFMGLLKDPDTGQELPPSSLVATKYLPSLNDVVWERSERVSDLAADDQVELDKSHQIAIRRARLGVEILKRPSDNNTKYDLFQRLNAGGTQANAQELRNCIVIMVNKDYFLLLKRLADLPDFREVISVTDDQIERQRHLELATRFLVHNYIPYDGKLGELYTLQPFSCLPLLVDLPLSLACLPKNVNQLSKRLMIDSARNAKSLSAAMMGFLTAIPGSSIVIVKARVILG